MSNNCLQLPSVTDWEMLIMEVQTDPDETMTSDAYIQIYNEIHGYLHTVANKWLSTRKYSEAHDGALVAIGLDKVFSEIRKFNIPDTNSERIGRSFKAWVGICCRREWSKRVALEQTVDLTDITESLSTQAPSAEDILIAEQENSKSHTQTSHERGLMKSILRDELDSLPRDMRDAILETEEQKLVDKPGARGLKGESKIIADRYGYTTGSIRTRRSRLLKKVQDRYNKEILK